MQILFDTATFDDIEREKKVKFEAQLSLVGGTMGLLTGFSIMSGIEIIFFLFRLNLVIYNFQTYNNFFFRLVNPFKIKKIAKGTQNKI